MVHGMDLWKIWMKYCFERCKNWPFTFDFLFSILRSVDLSTTTDSKQFQELLLERTKVLAAQTEALKSANSEGKFYSSIIRFTN